jgi:peptide/nickel transport system permease protein
MKGNRSLFLGASMLAFLLFLSVFGPILPFIDAELKPRMVWIKEDGQVELPPYPSSTSFPLGSDLEGRDLLSLLVMGTRDTMGLVVLIVLLRYGLALPLAVLAVPGSVLQRFVRFWSQGFTFLPVLFIAIIYMNLPFLYLSDHRLWWVIIGLAALEAGRVSLLFQEQMHMLARSEFVTAGIMIGHSPWGLFRRYYLPPLLPQLCIQFTLDMGRVMLLLGSLGLLGIYVEQSLVGIDRGVAQMVSQSAAWPILLADVRGLIRSEPYLPYMICSMIAFAVLTFNLLGEGLRNHFEARTSIVIKRNSLHNE